MPALIPIAAAVIGGMISSDASRSAANKGKDAAEGATGLQRDIYNQNRADQEPYRQAGYGALGQINALMGLPQLQASSTFDPAAYLKANPDVAADSYWGAHPYDHYQQFGQNEGRAFTGTAAANATTPAAANPLNALMQTPGYQFGLSQGTQAIDRSAASHGSLYSGATLKALQRFGQDYAGTKLNDTLNQLKGVAGLGQTSLGATGNGGMNYANQAGQNMLGAGNFAAGNALNQGNIWGNAINGISAYGQRNGWFTGSGNSPSNAQLETDWNNSDVRLKTNIRHIGVTERGHNVYAWDWKSGGSGVGVIAQEVQQSQPDAVRAGKDGFLMVDYAKV